MTLNGHHAPTLPSHATLPAAGGCADSALQCFHHLLPITPTPPALDPAPPPLVGSPQLFCSRSPRWEHTLTSDSSAAFLSDCHRALAPCT